MKDKKEVKKTPAKKAAKAKEEKIVITSYKGFNLDWKCRGFQYEVGRTYEHMGEVKACQSGFHACEHPFDVFNYYSPAGSRFALVEQSGITDKEQGGDSKIASQLISIKAEIDTAYLVKAAIEFTKSKCLPIDPSSPASATGTQGAASATGIRGAASALGTQGAASATGIQGAASAAGYQGAALATGTQGAASALGTQGAASATGTRGAALATGTQGAASALGTQGAASATGTQGAASATGTQGAALATGAQGAALAAGYQGAALAAGYQGAALAAGIRGAASALGEQGVACGLGCGSKALAAKTGAIVLVHRNDDGEIVHIRSAKVGEQGIKPDTWYRLDKEGQFVECGA